MSGTPDEPTRDGEPETGEESLEEETAEHQPDGGDGTGRDGLTEEFEAEFGEEFGADVAGELAAEEERLAHEGDEPEPPTDEEERADVDEDDLVDDESPAFEEVADEGEALEEEPADEDDEGDAEPAGPDPLEVLSQETVEADVLALGDEEEARERAEREGTSEADAEQAEATVVQAAAVGAAAGPPTEEQADEGGAEPEEEAPEEDGPPKTALWARFLTASLVIVISMATATSVSILLYFTKIAKGLGGLPGVQEQITAVEGGEPETILIMGSDKRPGDEAARSDTTMLLRLDPDNDAIALLSLPRDLRVNIPGRGVARLNEAYAIGGPKLTTRVVKNLTGLDINHVVNVDFEGFEKAISAIDCVYVDVDRQYFNSNEGLDPSEYYAEIDIKAGYQLLCGDRALQYVRYRHTDNDIVRGARQQDFLREARQKIGPARLFRDREELIKIFTKYTTSDIDDPFTLKEVLELFLASADAPVKQIHFQGTLGKSYVTASNEQIRAAVKQFLGFEDTPGPLEGKKKNKKKSGGGKDKKKKKKDGGGDDAPSLIDVTGEGLAWAEKFAPEVKFPVYYPTKLVPNATISDESREYEIADTDDVVHRAYKLVVSIPGESVPAEYYGVMGTTWTDPPILDNPSETKQIGGREYMLFYDGDRLRLVAWKTQKAAYWLSNTLGQTLEENEMLAIADSMKKLFPKR